MVKELHGKPEVFYYTFGTSDVFLIVDLPDAVTAAALSLEVDQSGAVHVKMHVLMSPEEIDQESKKSVNYQAPGK